MRYFIATYTSKPNGSYDEAVKVERNLKNKDLATASVIMDFKERKVLKLRLEDGTVGDKNWDRVWLYYHQHYKTMIEDLGRLNGYKIEIETEADPS